MSKINIELLIHTKKTTVFKLKTMKCTLPEDRSNLHKAIDATPRKKIVKQRID